ncbi:MAG: hypothetical protein IKN12_02640 [Selenomonadaceae bacterium]|nr:hypothetical protein [Selenomonadaceae bacterium]
MSKFYGLVEFARECGISSFKLRHILNKYNLVDDIHIGKEKTRYTPFFFDETAIKIIKDYLEKGIEPQYPSIETESKQEQEKEHSEILTKYDIHDIFADWRGKTLFFNEASVLTNIEKIFKFLDQQDDDLYYWFDAYSLEHRKYKVLKDKFSELENEFETYKVSNLPEIYFDSAEEVEQLKKDYLEKLEKLEQENLRLNRMYRDSGNYWYDAYKTKEKEYKQLESKYNNLLNNNSLSDIDNLFKEYSVMMNEENTFVDKLYRLYKRFFA